MKNYLVIYEPGERNWSAFCPDVPGCVATGGTRMETEQRMAEALSMHLAGLEEDGEDAPEPSGIEAGYVSVSLPAQPKAAGMTPEREAIAV